LTSFCIALAVCGVGILSIALAAPIAAGIDSYATVSGSYQNFSESPIPAGFFDPGSDPFTDTIGFQGVPLGPGATTDTVIQRLAKAKLSGNFTSSDTISIQIVALSMASESPITVTYNGGTRSESWNVHVGLTPTTQPLGSMTINATAKSGGDFAITSLPVLQRFTFTRVSDGATRVLDWPALDFNARAVPWTHTAPGNIIHSKGFCPSCDSPDGVPVEMFLNANFTVHEVFPATTTP
jgi:hypothetical protein